MICELYSCMFCDLQNKMFYIIFMVFHKPIRWIILFIFYYDVRFVFWHIFSKSLRSPIILCKSLLILHCKIQPQRRFFKLLQHKQRGHQDWVRFLICSISDNAFIHPEIQISTLNLLVNEPLKGKNIKISLSGVIVILLSPIFYNQTTSHTLVTYFIYITGYFSTTYSHVPISWCNSRVCRCLLISMKYCSDFLMTLMEIPSQSGFFASKLKWKLYKILSFSILRK